MNKRVNYYTVVSDSIDSLAFSLLREAKQFIIDNYPFEKACVFGKSSDRKIINYLYYKPTSGFSKTVKY